MLFAFLACSERLGGEHMLDLAEVPMPKRQRREGAVGARVAESPQTTVMPGSVAPCSGPMTWTMPCRAVEEREVRLGPELADVGVERLDLQVREIGSRMP